MSTSLKAVWIGFVALATDLAIAADMSGDELRLFLVGRTYYLETTAGGSLAQSGQAILYFAPEGGVINRIRVTVTLMSNHCWQCATDATDTFNYRFPNVPVAVHGRSESTMPRS